MCGSGRCCRAGNASTAALTQEQRLGLSQNLEMTEAGGFILRRSINVIIVKMEIKADRLSEFCTALNYINTGFFSSL
ncbi:hypothetical protein Nmel_010593 [Mimus melanotis]